MSAASGPPTTHVIGLGLAGLSTAVRLAAAGRALHLHEAAGQAGGRCRSFADARLGCTIDNGNHLLMSGNRSALAYLDLIGARGELEIGEAAAFPFVDLASGERWTVRLNDGPLPWWLLSPGRRVPGARAVEYLRALLILAAGPQARIADVVGTDGALCRRFWEPLTVAVLNTTPARGSARLLRGVLLETFVRGGRFCRPMLARRGLSETFVTPALAFLAAHGVEPRLNRPLRTLESADGRVRRLVFADGAVDVGPADSVVLALPPSRLAAILPDVPVPAEDSVIVNAHFRVPAGLPPTPRLLGLVNARTQWIFTRGEILSLTISAADALGLDREPAGTFLPLLWREVRTALRLGADADYLAARLIKEKRATFDQSPAGVARRPGTRTDFANLFLAGDATDTGLPATIEGAIRSGESAACAILQQ